MSKKGQQAQQACESRPANQQLFESLEPRVLLSTYLFTDQGSAIANGNKLQAIIIGPAPAGLLLTARTT